MKSKSFLAGTAISIFGLIVFIVATAYAQVSYFNVKCPKCGLTSAIKPKSILSETNGPILGGTITRKRMLFECPNCLTEFKGHAEKIEPDVTALELKLPEKGLPPPIPMTIPEVGYTNMILALAPETYRLRLLHATNLDLQAIIDMYSTNRSGMSVMLLERKP